MKTIFHNRWIRYAQIILGWISIAALFCFISADNAIVNMNPQGYGPWPYLLPRPTSFDNWIYFRNLSILIGFITGILALPRKIGIIALSLFFPCLFFIYWLHATW